MSCKLRIKDSIKSLKSKQISVPKTSLIVKISADPRLKNG